MSAGAALFAQLTGDTGVSAIVGTRVFPQFRPDEQAVPLVVYSVGDDVSDSSFDGKRMPVYQPEIVCIASTYAECQQLADAVSAALDERSGTWAGVTVLGCWLETSTDQVATDADTHERTYFIKEQTYRLVTR